MKPVLQALILAEKVALLADHRMMIFGTFTEVVLAQPLPAVQTESGTVQQVAHGGAGSPWAYICLTDVCESTTISLQFVNLKRNEVVYRTEITIKEVHRLEDVEIHCPLPAWTDLDLQPGLYAFEIVCDGEIVGSRRVRISHCIIGGS